MFTRLLLISLLAAFPVMAQSKPEPVVTFTGPLGELNLSAGYIRADTVVAGNETMQLAIAMNREARHLFAHFTQTNKNLPVAFSICGSSIQQLTVTGRDATGFVQTRDLPAEDAELFAAVMNDARGCPTS